MSEGTAVAMDQMPGRKAVIYCRVSSFEKGAGLESQAARCREFARYKGLEVIEIFEDKKSGSLIERPGMQAMLRYLCAHRKQGLVVHRRSEPSGPRTGGASTAAGGHRVNRR